MVLIHRWCCRGTTILTKVLCSIDLELQLLFPLSQVTEAAKLQLICQQGLVYFWAKSWNRENFSPARRKRNPNFQEPAMDPLVLKPQCNPQREWGYQQGNARGNHIPQLQLIPSQNLVFIAEERDRPITSYACRCNLWLNSGIVEPNMDANHFNLKLVMCQMLHHSEA